MDHAGVSYATLIAAILVAALASGCKDPPPANTPAEPEQARAKAVQPGTIDDKEQDPNIRPVYPTTNVKVSALAERLCEALHGVPRKRYAECCKRGTGVVLTSECVRNLSGAISAEAVTLDEEAVARCEAAMTKTHEGCDWVGPNPPAMPAECSGLIDGKLPKESKCRSSLECAEGLRCLGVGPTDQGVCKDPPKPGTLCGTSVDTLAVYTRQDDYESEHPACNGYCERNRCMPLAALGAECKANAHCGRGNRCSSGKCVAGALAKEGDTCLGGDCAQGFRCVNTKCIAPKAPGAACSVDQECKSACKIAEGAAAGVCEQTCETIPKIRR